ncbi:hypothetical protein DFH06DRAFT_1393083 [Mycena polygramma]|nr:hypothetical protein DFH06DRAFT_1393083 [Mycena polygramma]
MSDSAILPRASLVPLDSLLGAWLIGLIVSSVLFGVYLYFTQHYARDDPALVKVFVVLLLSLDTLHLALTSHSFYFVTVTNFGDYVQLRQPSWSLILQSAIGFLLSAQVQLFYAFRIYIISNKRLAMPIVIAICAFAELALGLAFMHKNFHDKFVSDTKSDVPYPTSAFSLEVACDVFITGAMIYHFLKNKSGLFQRTNKAINLLVSYSVSSGALTTVFVVCSLVTWVTSTTTLIYGPFFFVIVRLYGLSFMTISVPLGGTEHYTLLKVRF